MLINPELGRMTTADLNRRYQMSFIKYRGQIVFVNGFQGTSLTYTRDPEGAASVKFSWKDLDISRPRPRWLQIDDEFKYLAYVMDRQFCRGFSDQNVTIFDPAKGIAHRGIIGRPRITQQLIEEFYNNKPVARSQTVDQICATLEKFSGVLLSSQLLLHKSNQGNMDLYFREEKIGTIDAYSKDYEAELKETIEGLSDENIKRILGYRRPAPKQEKRQAEINIAPDVVFDAGIGQWQIRAGQLQFVVGEERQAGGGGGNAVEAHPQGRFPWGRWDEIVAGQA